jgi:hypothetical protein
MQKLAWSPLAAIAVALFIGGDKATAANRVEIIHVPGASNVMKAETGPGNAIHLLYDTDDGPQYVKSTDGGKTFSTPVAVVDRASRKPGLQFITWDMAVDGVGRVHVALGNNAWKLKLPQTEWGLFYAALPQGVTTFSPLRSLNHKPSEGFSIAADFRGAVTASFLSGKLFTMSSVDRGGSFADYRELDPSLDPCKCCTTSTAYGSDGRLAVLYREESNNERDIYLALTDPSGKAGFTRTRISGTPWKLEGCPMTYFSIRPTSSGYVAAWPTKGQIYFARLDRNGTVLPPGEVATPGRCGIRTGILALAARDGTVLVTWKNQDTLHWQCYDSQGLPLDSAGSAPGSGTGAAAVVLADGNFAVFP